MNEFQLQVRGNVSGKNVNRIRPVFVWKTSEHLTQFTVGMSLYPDYHDVIFLRDTHEHYCIYDNVVLKPHMTYYVRVRSGMGEWSKTSFVTGE